MITLDFLRNLDPLNLKPYCQQTKEIANNSIIYSQDIIKEAKRLVNAYEKLTAPKMTTKKNGANNISKAIIEINIKTKAIKKYPSIPRDDRYESVLQSCKKGYKSFGKFYFFESDFNDMTKGKFTDCVSIEFLATLHKFSVRVYDRKTRTKHIFLSRLEARNFLKSQGFDISTRPFNDVLNAKIKPSKGVIGDCIERFKFTKINTQNSIIK